MFFYVIKFENGVKIGMTENIEQRLLQYKDKEDYRVFSIETEDSYIKCVYMENEFLKLYNCDSEYLPTIDFDLVVEQCSDMILNTTISHLKALNLGVDFTYNQDGFILVNSLVDYCNEIRKNLNKPSLRIDKYLGAFDTKLLIDEYVRLYGESPIMSKRGKYGGTFMKPLIALDFIMWSSAKAKFKVIDNMFTNAKEHEEILNIDINK